MGLLRTLLRPLLGALFATMFVSALGLWLWKLDRTRMAERKAAYELLSRQESVHAAARLLEPHPYEDFRPPNSSGLFNSIRYYPNVEGDQVLVAGLEDRLVLVYIRSFSTKQFSVNGRSIPVHPKVMYGRYEEGELEEIVKFYRSLSREEMDILFNVVKWVEESRYDHSFVRFMARECAVAAGHSTSTQLMTPGAAL